MGTRGHSRVSSPFPRTSWNLGSHPGPGQRVPWEPPRQPLSGIGTWHPVRKPHVITGASGAGPGLQRGNPARPVTRARAEGRTCVRCGEGIPGPCRELRPQRAREELRGPRLLPPHPGRRKPDQRGERTASPPEAAPPAARGHAPRGPAPPHRAWAGLRAKPRAPHPWSSCCAPSCAPRPCGPSAAPAPAASARAEPTTRTQAPCSSKSTAGRSQASKLGEQMADLHLYNQKLREKLKEEENTVGRRGEGAEPRYVNKFGFHTVTCCGFIPQVNEWQDDWPTFFARHWLQAQLDLIEKDYADREARELWSRLQVKIPDLFCGLEIVPALLHGDLWSGNVAEDDVGPIIYDPASFYGHSEFELAIALMFGGFPRSFFTAYHRKIPKAPGFDQRLLLYQLFNYLNHWNHFGREYRSPSLGTMRRLLWRGAPAPCSAPCPLLPLALVL
uniref:protein-ribulosamine 3-kinase n=1 Tax=Papio anubis TaxID=9555 RepID=A0A8I5NW72_PAPAN